jgi:hypothetical protein
MNTPNEFEARLLKADPAQNTPATALSEDIVRSATKSKPKLDLRQQFELLTARTRGFALGGLVSGAAAIVAVTIVVNPTPAPLIQLAASPESGENRSAMVSETSEDKMWSMPYSTYEYVAGPELSNETGAGQVYKLVRQGTPESVLTTIAGVFDIQGSVKKYPDFSDQNPGYFFGESDDPWGVDNVNPMVSLWWSGTGSWNYYNPGDITVSSSSCVDPDSEGNCREWTEVLPTPELLPSRAEAVAKALQIFNATGLSVSESDLFVDYSEWGVYISAAMSVDGQPTSIEWYIGWSSTGEISYAGGHAVAAEAVGVFETISAVQSVERLSDWRWSGAAATSYYAKYQPETSESQVKTDQIEPAVTDSAQPAEPEIVKLTVVTAERTIVSIWDAAGDVWLVPGFVMVNDQGWWNSVIALVEGVIALPEPSVMQIEPLPADDSSVGN